MIDNLDSDSLCEALVDHVPLAIAILDTEMRYLAASRRWITDYGLDGHNIMGRSHYEVFPEIPEAWRSVHQKALQGSRHQEGEEPFTRASGETQWIRWAVAPWHRTDGEIGGITIFSEDVTVRKMHEEALRKSEAYLMALFQSASDYVLLLDPKVSGPPVIVDGNDAAFAKFGYAREEMVGQAITRFETATSAKLFKQRAEQIRLHESAHFEVEHLCKNGSTFFARVSAKVVEDGVSHAMILVVEQDITPMKLAEERQRMLLEENRRLTHRLMQVQEDERRQLARSLHDNLGQMLTSINTDAFYIAKHAEHTGIRETAKQISTSAQRIFDANHEILLKLRPSELDALGLEAALVELAAFWRKRAGIDCVLHADEAIDRLPEEHAIAAYRLVQEGLTNAIRHGEARRINVALRVLEKPAGSATLRLEIEDNGKGLHIDASPSGLGIVGMRERVHALQGEFALSTMPHSGVRIVATIPLPV